MFQLLLSRTTVPRSRQELTICHCPHAHKHFKVESVCELVGWERSRYTAGAVTQGEVRPTGAMMAKVTDHLWGFAEFYETIIGCKEGLPQTRPLPSVRDRGADGLSLLVLPQMLGQGVG